MAETEKEMKMMPLEEMHRPRNLTYEKVYGHVLELFGNDRDKTNAWWMARQEELGGKAPYEMVKEGKARKLMRILERCGV